MATEISEAVNLALRWAQRYVIFNRVIKITDRPWSKTLWLDTGSDGGVYLKILPKTRAHEARISYYLSQNFPMNVPSVIAYEPEGLLLMKNHGGKPHNKSSVRQAYNTLMAYAKMQAKSISMTDFIGSLPRYDVDHCFEDLLHCLSPVDTPSTHQLNIKTPAIAFLGKAKALEYWRGLQKQSGFFSELLHNAGALPIALEHGDLQYDNAAEMPNGETVLYDWGEVTAGPAGLSLSNPLFLGSPARAMRLVIKLRTSSEYDQLGHELGRSDVSFDALHRSIGVDELYLRFLGAYVDRLTEEGVVDRSTLLEGLPGSILAGAIRWLVSWSLEENYTTKLSKVAGRWWCLTLDDVMSLAPKTL